MHKQCAIGAQGNSHFICRYNTCNYDKCNKAHLHSTNQHSLSTQELAAKDGGLPLAIQLKGNILLRLISNTSQRIISAW